MSLPAIVLAVTGYLIDVHGVVSLQRHTATRSCPASIGAEVHDRDTLRVNGNARATILCPDLLTTWKPPSRAVSGILEGCPQQEERIRIRDGQKALGVRSAQPAPWVLMPSNTAVLTANPTVRWEAVAGAKRYRVSLFERSNPSRPIWGPALIEGTSLQYDGRHALIAGVPYFVRVESDGGAGEVANGAPFVVAPADLSVRTAERLRHFEQTIPEKTPRDIATALYFLSQNLRADALLLLERATSSVKSPALKLLYAQCAGDVGNFSAQRRILRKALDESVAIADMYSEAEALLALADLSAKREEAAQFSQRAAHLLRKLGIQNVKQGE